MFKKKVKDNKEEINFDDKLQKKILVNMITSLRGVGGILLVPIFTIYGNRLDRWLSCSQI